MIRTWTIPSSDSKRELSIDICEPPLTGDDLGLKTWGTAFVMAKKLEEIAARYFQKALSLESRWPRVLEVGAGTGLLGITAAMLWDASFTLTDLPEILPNLSSNILRNNDKLMGSVEAEVLDWAYLDRSELSSGHFDVGFKIAVLQDMAHVLIGFQVILVSDPLYDDVHPKLVAKVIAKYLKPGQDSRVLAVVPLRDETTEKLKTTFVANLIHHGFESIIQDEDVCYDDWEDARGDDELVKCWWGIWQWRDLVVGS